MRRPVLIGLVLLAMAAPVSAQIAFDAAVNGTATTATSQTTAFTMSAVAGGCLVVTATGDATTDLLTTATYNGVAMTLVTAINANPGAVYWQNTWALPAPASGTNNIVVTASTSIHIHTLASSYTGVGATGCPATSANGSGSGDPYTATITTATGNNWTLETINASVGLVASTNFTTRADDGGATFFIADSNAPVAIGSNSMSVTGAGGTKQHIILALAPTATSAGPSSLLLGVGR